MDIGNLKNIFDHNLILLISLMVVTALALATVCTKLHLPKITGYIFTGILFGDPVLHLFSKENFKDLHSINLIALGLMSITIGSHLNFHKLKNSGKRIFFSTIFETTLAFVAVFASLYYLPSLPFNENDRLLFSLLISSIALATAPAATVAVVKETRSKGVFVNTLMPVVAINNVLCILIFGLILNLILFNFEVHTSTADLVFSVFRELFFAIVTGIFLGFLLRYFSDRKIHSNRYILTLVFLTVMIATGIANLLSINSMLPCMIIGIFITNTSKNRNVVLSIFEDVEHLILIIFFCLAGAHIDAGSIKIAGLVGFVYFIARGIGKVVGGSVGAIIGNAPPRIYKYLGTALLPQAGVAIGLVIMVSEVSVLQEYIDFLTTLILAVVAMNEIAGPLATKWSLFKSGDAGKDRLKLINFLEEEFIIPNLKSENKEDVLNELINFFIKSHPETAKFSEEITRTVLEREKDISTATGRGIAIPHGIIGQGPAINGVLGISKKGIHFGAPDGKPVHIFILIITPEEHKTETHLKVLSEISKLLSIKTVREDMYNASSAVHVCEILRQHEEEKDFNYFID